MTNTRICKKCLLREMEESGQQDYVSRYLENLDQSARANENKYEERLQICKSCELLLEAMCRACGCYVELRAALDGQHCPYNKW